MKRKEKIITLNGYLLKDEPTYKKEAEQFPNDLENQRRLLRSLMNLRYPKENYPRNISVCRTSFSGGARRKGGSSCMRLACDKNRSKNFDLAGRYYPIGRGCDRKRSKFTDAWLFPTVPRLHRQCDPFCSGTSVAG